MTKYITNEKYFLSSNHFNNFIEIVMFKKNSLLPFVQGGR